MTTNTRRLTTVAMALTMLALVGGNAHACCGASTAYYSPSYTTSYYAPQTSYYAPSYTAGYAPATAVTTLPHTRVTTPAAIRATTPRPPTRRTMGAVGIRD